MTETATKVTAGLILELLRQRHPHNGGEWATFAELNIGTGSQGGRWIDFFALNCYPSKKFRSVGYEIKVSRSDFAKELIDPTKRELTEKYAGECYFAVPHGMVEKDEVPEGWGLIYATANGLKVVKYAAQRTPEPYPMAFVASLARRGADVTPEAAKAAWQYMGQDLNYQELVELALKMFESEKRNLINEGEKRYRNSEQWKTRDLVYRAFEKVYAGVSIWQKTQTDIESILRGKSLIRLNEREARDLRNAYNSLKSVFEKDGES